MKRTLLLFSFSTVFLCVVGPTVFGQEAAGLEGPQGQRLQEERLQVQRIKPRPPHGQRRTERVLYVTPDILKAGRPKDLGQIKIQAAAGATIPLWNYSTVGYDGVTYTGMMVGRSPFFHGHRVTTIPTVLIPVKLTFADTNTVFDPSVPDACAPGGVSVVSLILKSPIFQNSPFTMNGANVGSTQYLDAFQRANFWTLVSATPYHTVFSTTPTVLPVQSVTVPAANGTTDNLIGQCRADGQMDIAWWDNYVQMTLIPSLAAQGVGPGTFPQIVLDSVAERIPAGCCATGYHNAFLNGGVFQSYSVNEWDTSGHFGGTTDTMSHEVAEWMDDPDTSNPTPPWGFIGQDPTKCQGGPTSTTSNLEVGDPLTGTAFPAVTLNGVTYDLQELAFFSWFYGGTSLGSGGKYSNNGTFSGFAIACPPGGTH